jgi:tetratricopeptide (TPR) repeat protein
MVVGPDGSEIDWHVGYDPPPDRMLDKLTASAQGIDTFKSLSERFAQNPQDAGAVFKLALKYNDRFQEDKALEKFEEVVKLDPEGKTGTLITEIEKARVTFTEYSEYQLALAKARSRENPNPEPLKAFIEKYPKSDLLKRAYQSLSPSMARAPKEEADRFFEEFVENFKDDPDALNAWLTHIVRTKENLDKGVELAEKLHSLTRYKSTFPNNRTMADLYLLKEDKIMADLVYGKDFIENRTRIFALDLIRYADYWAGKNENLLGAQEITELALKLQPDQSYILSQAAGVYVKMSRDDKALELFGPDFFKKNKEDANNLWSYANFWARQGKNLESALEAAKRAVELEPEAYFSWDVLSAVHQKLKNFDEAVKASEKALELADSSMKEYLKSKLDQVKAAAERAKKKQPQSSLYRTRSLASINSSCLRRRRLARTCT